MAAAKHNPQAEVTSGAAVSLNDAVHKHIGRILASGQNFFERLGLEEKTTDRATVRKKYRLVALSCHPDKCKHPKATEAFQLLSEAFECLHDDLMQQVHIQQLSAERQKADKRARLKMSRKRKGRGRSKQRKKRAKGVKVRSWKQVEADLRRREMEDRVRRQNFVSAQSAKYTKRSLIQLVRRAQDICQTLDERAGMGDTLGLWKKEEPPPEPPNPLERFRQRPEPPPIDNTDYNSLLSEIISHLHAAHNYRDLDDEVNEFQ